MPARHWNDVTANIKACRRWGTISKIEPSHFDAGHGLHRRWTSHLMDNREPWLYKTTDFGKTWTKITDGLPKGHPLVYARGDRESQSQGHAVRRHGQRASTRWTTGGPGSS